MRERCSKFEAWSSLTRTVRDALCPIDVVLSLSFLGFGCCVGGVSDAVSRADKSFFNVCIIRFCVLLYRASNGHKARARELTIYSKVRLMALCLIGTLCKATVHTHELTCARIACLEDLRGAEDRERASYHTAVLF